MLQAKLCGPSQVGMEMRSAIVAARLLSASLVVSACGPSPPNEAPPGRPDQEVGEPMQPLRPRETPPEEPGEDAPPAASLEVRRVTHRVERLGRHRFARVLVRDGPWDVEGLVAEPGEESFAGLDRELHGCRTTALGARDDERATWCPGVGVVVHSGRERGGILFTESLLALRRGDVTWSASPCDVFPLLPPDERASLCEHPIRTLGSGPGPNQRGCRWRFTLDRPHGERTAAVTVRLAPDRASIEEWAGAEADRSLVETSRSRTWIARGPEWTVGVRIDRRACGDADGGALAGRLLDLAPASP